MTLPTLEWSAVDADNLRSFLNTQTGHRLMAKLYAAAPRLLSKGDVNEILIRSGEVRGCAIAVMEILNLTSSPIPDVQEEKAYPSLYDDDAWKDGNKLTQTETPQE